MDNDQTLAKILHLIETASAQMTAAKQMLADLLPEGIPSGEPVDLSDLSKPHESPEGKVIEGVFDGQNMVGPDEKQYSVPANYASKSKLVEGDVLKLTIAEDGSFVYKQIGPVERKRVVGVLTKDEDSNEYRVVAGDGSYRVLLASITYFKGQQGDEVVVLIPMDREASWAAVENIIKKAA